MKKIIIKDQMLYLKTIVVSLLEPVTEWHLHVIFSIIFANISNIDIDILKINIVVINKIVNYYDNIHMHSNIYYSICIVIFNVISLL